MEQRHSSPSPSAGSPRPKAHRKRSNSFPIVDALGCSTPEAKLILAEGRAAVRSRQKSMRRRGRRNRSDQGEAPYRPKDHIEYLYGQSAIAENEDSPAPLADSRSTRHARIPSNVTDGSTSTITATIQPPVNEILPVTDNSTGQLGDYSANLAKFIQTQLQAIPSYSGPNSAISPRSCPDLTFPAPPQSPVRTVRRPIETPHVIEIPAVRPPLRSQFSAWSSTDDETDDELPPLPSIDHPWNSSKTSNDTPSILGYYQGGGDGTFLFPSTPDDRPEQRSEAQGLGLSEQSAQSDLSSESRSTSIEDDYVSSDASAHYHIPSSSAPSFSSTSTASYFDYKRTIALNPQVRDRIIAAVSPHNNPHKVLTAISPFEGQAITNVHDILVESQQRVIVEGLSFDLVRDISVPDTGMRRVPTPC